MRKLKRSAVTTVVLLGLFVSSGIALAETHDGDVVEEETTDTALMADTLFSFGYDLINGLLLWNISSLDEPCALPDAEESDPGADPDTELEPDCELTEGEVAGPNGQVNHGTFMRLFNSLFEGPGRGCVVRHLAQSDLGKGDQKVKGGEEGDDSVEAGENAEGEDSVEFTTIETVCQRGPGDDAELAGEGKGKPPWAGKPEGKGKPASPGNSGSAPGHNK